MTESGKKKNAATPKEISKRVEFYVPEEWSALQSLENLWNKNNDDIKCCIEYNANDELFYIISKNEDDEKAIIWDVIDPNDMIGVDIEIKLRKNAEQKENDADVNAKAKTTLDVNAKAKTTSATAANKGIAILTLYAYPKKDISKLSLLNRCNVVNYEPTPFFSIKKKANKDIDGPKKEENAFGNRIPNHRKLQLAPSYEDLQDVSALVKCMEDIMEAKSNKISDGNTEDSVGTTKKESDPNATKSTSKPLLVIVNPCSGPKQNALEVYKAIVSPMLSQAKIQHEFLITKHANHAKERMANNYEPPKDNSGDVDNDSNNDITFYDGIITMGGDGIIHETLQGFLTRTDATQVLKELKCGFIGCGTSNGYVKSISYEKGELSSPTDSTYIICKKKTKYADISYYSTPNRNYLSFLTYSYGMIADLDIESEVLRSLGPLRFEIWAVYNIVRKRKYGGKLSYLPPSATNDSVNDGNMKSIQIPPTEDDKVSPPLNEPIPYDDGKWKSIEGDFVMIWTHQVSHAGESNFSSPLSKLQDGVFQILVIR